MSILSIAGVLSLGGGVSAGYYRSITIDHTKVGTLDLTDYPVLVSLTNASLKSLAHGGRVRNANGYDIAVYSDSGLTTLLDFERVVWNATTGALELWVRVPTVSHTADTVIYLGYGDTSITTDQSNPTAVWDSHFLGVYHMADGTTLSGADSTANAFTATATGTPPPAAGAGQIDGGADWTSAGGSSPQLNATGMSLASSHDITLSWWQRIPTGGRGGMCLGTADSPNRCNCHAPYSDNTLYWDYGSIVGSGRISTSYAGFFDAWAFITIVAKGDSTLKEIRINGSVSATNGTSGAPTSGISDLHIGVDKDGIACSDSMDECRISDSVRLIGWTIADYNSQSDPATFSTLGSEVPV